MGRIVAGAGAGLRYGRIGRGGGFHVRPTRDLEVDCRSCRDVVPRDSPSCPWYFGMELDLVCEIVLILMLSLAFSLRIDLGVKIVDV